MFFVGIGVTQQSPKLVSNVVLVDLLILGLIGLWVMLLGTPLLSNELTLRLLIPFGLIFAGSILTMIDVSIRGFAVADLIRDVGSFLFLFGAASALSYKPRRDLPWATFGVFVGLVILAIQLTLDRDELRAQATFPNPNIAAHLLFTYLVLIFVMPTPRWAKVVAALVTIPAWVSGASFGATIQFAGAFVYGMLGWLYRRRRGIPRLLAQITPIVGVIGLALLPVAWTLFNQGVGGFDMDRFEKSSRGRLRIWTQGLGQLERHPIGLSPAGLANTTPSLDAETEIHQEILSFLIERGPIGLLGLLLMWLAFWRMGRPGGPIRVLTVCFFTAAMFRETLHYRHLWLAYAIAIIHEWTRRADAHEATSAAAAHDTVAATAEGRSSPIGPVPSE